MIERIMQKFSAKYYYDNQGTEFADAGKLRETFVRTKC